MKKNTDHLLFLARQSEGGINGNEGRGSEAIRVSPSLLKTVGGPPAICSKKTLFFFFFIKLERLKIQ